MCPIVTVMNLQGQQNSFLEKQTSPPSLVIALCMCSVRVWPLAGPIKWNRPSVTIWSVFQNPVTYYVTNKPKSFIYSPNPLSA